MVAVPAKNEARRIGRALEALGRLHGETRASCRLVVLANNCTDATAEVARRAARGLPFLTEVIEVQFAPEQAHVGQARAQAVALAAAHLADCPEGLLATTDADTLVAPDWARRMRAALGAGADLVAGRILTLPEERRRMPAALRRLQLQDAAYQLLASQLISRLDPQPHDPWPRHHQHFGASLGLKLSAWRQLGGWPAARCLEDLALVHAAGRLDLRLRHCPQVRVWTSARVGGRVDLGLSSQLREWQTLQAQGGGWQVPGAAEVGRAAQATAALRQAWGGATVSPGHLEALWMVGASALNPALIEPTFGLAHEAATLARDQAGHWRRHHLPVPLEQALRDLRRMLAVEQAARELVTA